MQHYAWYSCACLPALVLWYGETWVESGTPNKPADPRRPAAQAEAEVFCVAAAIVIILGWHERRGNSLIGA